MAVSQPKRLQEGRGLIRLQIHPYASSLTECKSRELKVTPTCQRAVAVADQKIELEQHFLEAEPFEQWAEN